MILETSFIIDFLRNEANAVSKIQKLRQENIPIQITTPSIFELWSGASSLEKSERQKNNLAMFIQEQLIIPLDAESAEKAGKIDGTLVKKGLQIQAEDCMIAGIAIKNNISLLTKDSDFKRIDGLKIEEY